MPIIQVPVLGNVEFPDSMSQEEIASAINKQLGITPGEKFGTWDTLLRGSERGVTSSLRGAAGLLGANEAAPSAESYDPMGNITSNIPEFTSNGPMDIKQQAQFEMMKEQNPVSAYGSQFFGSIADPLNLLPIGSVRTVAQGVKNLAIAGGIGGLLEPTYGEDSRLVNTALGVGLGGVLGAGVGGIAQKFGKPLIEALTPAAEEAQRKAGVPYILGGTGRDNTVFPEGIGEVGQAAQVGARSLQDNIAPWMQNIADAETRTRIEADITGGDYRSFFTDTPFRMADSPSFRVEQAFSADNPLREQNLAAYLKAGYKAEDPEQLLTRIAAANKAGLGAELDTTPINIPADSAVNFLLNRKVQEIGGRDLMTAYIPQLQRGVDMIQNIDELFLNGRAAGMTDAEIAAVFKKDFDEVKPLLFSAVGNVSNIGRALQAAKAQKRVIGSTAEIIKGLSKNNGQELGDILALKDAVSMIKNAPGTSFEKNAAIASLTKDMVKQPNWKDKFGEYVVNAYISGLATPMVNAASGIAKLGLLSAERIIQSATPGSKVTLREVVPAFRGMMDGVLEGAYFAKEGFLRGSPLDAAMPEIKGAIGMQTGASKIEKVLGQVVRTPGRVGVGTDEFFKAIFRKMEFNAQAARLANTGKYGDSETVYNLLRNVNTKAADWRDNVLKAPGLANMSDATRMKLIQDVGDFAKAATFQQDLGKFGQNVLRFRAQHPEMAWVVPFVKTPINIMKDALSYTPLGIFSKNLPTDVKIARTAIGVGITTAVAQAIGSKTLTGSYPKDADKRNAMIAAGLPEYSIKIGDTWYSYARVEPLATIMGSSADGISAVHNYFSKNPLDRKIKDLTLDVVGGITKNIASKTFLEGISGVLQAIHDPARYGGSFINSFAGLLVPSFVAAPARAQDPNMRVVTNFGEAVQNRIPNLGLSTGIPGRQELPKQSMIYGGERPNPSYGAAAFTGIQSTPAIQNEIQKEAARIKVDYNLPSKSLKGVELEGKDQANYQALSSQYADMILPSIVSSGGYKAAPDSLKKVIFEKAMQKARSAATNILFGEKMKDPEFQQKYIRHKLQQKGVEEE
jgi:hypothetical protein